MAKKDVNNTELTIAPSRLHRTSGYSRMASKPIIDWILTSVGQNTPLFMLYRRSEQARLQQE